MIQSSELSLGRIIPSPRNIICRILIVVLIKRIQDGEWVFDFDQAHCRNSEMIILNGMV